MDDEFYYLPEYYYWDYETPTSIGCPFGGTFSFELSDKGEVYLLNNCAFSEGFVMTGSGAYDYDSSVFSLQVKVTGLAEGELTYTRDQDDVRTVSGIYKGETIDLSR